MHRQIEGRENRTPDKGQVREQMGQTCLQSKTKWLFCSEKPVVPSGLPRGAPSGCSADAPHPTAPGTLQAPPPCIHASGRAPHGAPGPEGLRPSGTRPHPPPTSWKGSCSSAAGHPACPEEGLRLEGRAQRERP